MAKHTFPLRFHLPLKAIFLSFWFYAFFGWAYEVFLEVVIYKWGYSDRGVLFGPYCPVYGVGALLFLLLFYRLILNKPLKRKLLLLPVIFLLSALVATLVELGASYLCEWILGSWPWQTYASYKYNFQARIALSPSLRFGLGGILFLYVIQPLLDQVLRRLPPKILNGIFAVLAVVTSADILFSLAKAAGLL